MTRQTQSEWRLPRRGLGLRTSHNHILPDNPTNYCSSCESTKEGWIDNVWGIISALSGVFLSWHLEAHTGAHKCVDDGLRWQYARKKTHEYHIDPSYVYRINQFIHFVTTNIVSILS